MRSAVCSGVRVSSGESELLHCHACRWFISFGLDRASLTVFICGVTRNFIGSRFAVERLDLARAEVLPEMPGIEIRPGFVVVGCGVLAVELHQRMHQVTANGSRLEQLR